MTATDTTIWTAVAALKAVAPHNYRIIPRSSQGVVDGKVVEIESIDIFAADRASGREVVQVVRASEFATLDAAKIIKSLATELKAESRRAAKARTAARRQAIADKT